MIKLTKFYPKDLIAIIVLLACFLLKAMGINTYIDIVLALVIGYYFGRRMDGEGEPGRDLNEKVTKIENEIKGSETVPPKLFPKPIPGPSSPASSSS